LFFVDELKNMLTIFINILPAAAAAGCTCRQLTQTLPSLTTISIRDAPSIACLHLQSASHLQATMRLIAPQAMAAAHSADLAALADVSPTTAALVANAIEIQLFHLNRTRAVSNYMRMHVANRQRQAAEAAQSGPDSVVTSRRQGVANSSGSPEEPRILHQGPSGT
jgi:hypothetical protein